MQYNKKTVLASTLVATSAMAAYVPSEPWTTLTPTATYASAVTEYTSSFGIAVEPITTGSYASFYASSSATSSATKAKRAAAISQIGDGQIQATTSTGSASSTKSASSSSSASSTSSTSEATSSATSSGPIKAVSCKNNGTLSMTLKEGVLTDSKGRIGSIVANRQFQFDGPPPQAGAIYAKGWGITPEGNLAIGNEDVFWQCLSGNFYNLYDENIGSQCKPVHLEAIGFTDC